MTATVVKGFKTNSCNVTGGELCVDGGPRVGNAVADPGTRVNGSVRGEDTMTQRVMSGEHYLALCVCRAGQLRSSQSE